MAKREISAFHPDEHSFYDDLVTMTMSLSSIMYAIYVSTASNDPKEFHERPLSEWKSYIRPVRWPEQPFALPSKVTEGQLILFPFWVISQISLRGWPQYLEYQTGSVPEEALKFQVDTERRKRITSQTIGASFVNYYESVRPAIDEEFGGDTSEWPDVLNFARQVRNGFSHGGTFEIRNPNASPISWRQWSLTYETSGTVVLFGSESLAPGDIVWLMQDVDNLLSE